VKYMTRVREKRNAHVVLMRKSEGKRQLEENLEIHEIIILKYILKKWDEGIWVEFNWIHLIRNREMWRVFVTTKMNCLVPKNERVFWLSEKSSASQEGIYSLELDVLRVFNVTLLPLKGVFVVDNDQRLTFTF